ncbi:MAG: Glu-tRNA(Gln) amidotransferase subunit GatD [Candidatus Woesearchaeota archaeon]
MNINPGDYVKITTKDSTFEGMIIERPKTLDDEIITIKLESGYNIGINKKNILSIEKISEKRTQVKSESNLIKIPEKRITLIAVGGTISSKIDYETGGVSAKYDVQNFLKKFPELNDYNIYPIGFMNKMSEDFLPEDWMAIAREVYNNLIDNNVEGVIITHGTDTMSYTASILSFFLQNLNKPVILTGAQRSLDRPSTDAKINLICSAIAAKSSIAEIGIVMHGSSNDDYCLWHFGTRVRKMHTSRRDAFRSINSLPIAKIYPDGKMDLMSNNVNLRNDKIPILDLSFEEKVGFIYVHPNMDPEIVDFFIDRGYKGLVIQGTGLGHVPTNCRKEIVSKIEKAIQSGIVVVITSQTLYGRVHPAVYSNLRKLLNLGCIFAQDMIPEVAYVKLCWVLGKTKNPEEVRKLMLSPISHEINPSSNFLSFLN